MQLPFISRKKHEKAIADTIDAVSAAAWDQADERYDAVSRENEKLKQALQDSSAAFIVNEGLKAIAAAIAAAAETHAAAAGKVAHATGALAVQTGKASDVQREWLELSKGNR